MEPNIKWTTKTTYVSHETGEELTKEEVEKNYRKIKCHKTAKRLGWRVEINHIWECEINNQLALEI